VAVLKRQKSGNPTKKLPEPDLAGFSRNGLILMPEPPARMPKSGAILAFYK